MIVAGLGFRRGCSAATLVALVRDAEARAGQRADLLAAPSFKAAEAGLREAAAVLDRRLVLVDRAALEAAEPACVTLSESVRAHVGVAAVAEAAALAAAGARSGACARLILPRIAAGGATCALATSAAP